jgi:hypothetical protein
VENEKMNRTVGKESRESFASRKAAVSWLFLKFNIKIIQIFYADGDVIINFVDYQN